MIRQVVFIMILHTVYSSLTYYSPIASAVCAMNYVNVTMSSSSVVYDRSLMNQQLAIIIQGTGCNNAVLGQARIFQPDPTYTFTVPQSLCPFSPYPVGNPSAPVAYTYTMPMRAVPYNPTNQSLTDMSVPFQVTCIVKTTPADPPAGPVTPTQVPGGCLSFNCTCDCAKQTEKFIDMFDKYESCLIKASEDIKHIK